MRGVGEALKDLQVRCLSRAFCLLWSAQRSPRMLHQHGTRAFPMSQYQPALEDHPLRLCLLRRTNLIKKEAKRDSMSPRTCSKHGAQKRAKRRQKTLWETNQWEEKAESLAACECNLAWANNRNKNRTCHARSFLWAQPNQSQNQAAWSSNHQMQISKKDKNYLVGMQRTFLAGNPHIFAALNIQWWTFIQKNKQETSTHVWKKKLKSAAKSKQTPK